MWTLVPWLYSLDGSLGNYSSERARPRAIRFDQAMAISNLVVHDLFRDGRLLAKFSSCTCTATIREF